MSEKQKKIAVLEDDMAMREIITQKLSKSGFVVKVAQDGESGIVLIEKEKPDTILMDIMMPGMDGYEVLKRLRSNKDKKLAATPVFILSNLWSREDKVKADKYKVVDYLVKAYFTPDQIVAKVRAKLV
ncbi:MAG: response regulator [Candidatus Doudnabacteria bacterium CG10_big_fil_rev_8_21_14_0_10_42_18]|uniref:Response regulator n=1 Tax=Candidatus Doudnabacteria bacterium CG10_big_fil_rev_8_21_14_0_10_42_18 TaxID=1974552 RepID=A0A2H0VAP9_9BACT|nr:MAG: response regulator [Candidatus Doudnabacteria bacterium CG10_big_fil_rev_8_21_14_0_10_42_18]